MENIKIILASKSPRRIEYLKNLGIDFEIIPAVKEEDMSNKCNVKKLSRILGRQKAYEVYYNTDGNRVVIGSDCMVYAKGKLFGKPKGEEDGRRMLKTLSGRWHKVITSLCVVAFKNGIKKEYNIVETVKVKFMNLTDDMIDDYIKTGDYKDKAGAYGVQSISSKFIEKVKGDYAAIVGLPYCILYKILYKEGLVV